MRGWGFTLILLGLGSFVLPMMGIQFRIMQLFGEYQLVGGLALAAAGGLMVFFGGSSDEE